MADLATLRKQLDDLKATRASGVFRTRFGDREVEYRRHDNEMATAIAALQNEIAALDGTIVRTINVRNKGWS